jgi:uncharacterized protein (TIGR00369 family)
MSATTEPGAEQLARMAGRWHDGCLVCGQANPGGLGLSFEVDDSGAAVARADCPDRLGGYEGMLHGGVISALLDGAMTNALLARGIPAVTAELKVRFRHPVRTGGSVTVRGWVTRSLEPLHGTSAELVQDGQVRAEATAKFMTMPGTTGPETGDHGAPGTAGDTGGYGHTDDAGTGGDTRAGQDSDTSENSDTSEERET